MKKALIGVAVFVVIVVVLVMGAVFLLLGNLNEIVKGIIEGSGSELMGVPVAVGEVNIRLKKGSGQITGLTIDNPPGYTTDKAFKMDLIRLDIGVESLGKSPLVIDELNIDKPILNCEVTAAGKINLKDLSDNMKRNTKKADKKAAEQQPETESTPKGEPMRMAFTKLIVKGVTVNVVSNLGESQQKSVEIPSIELKNVGGTTGVTPGELGEVVFGAIIESALKNALEQSLTREVEKAAQGLVDKLKKELGVEGKEGEKEAEGLLNKLQESLGGKDETGKEKEGLLDQLKKLGGTEEKK